MKQASCSWMLNWEQLLIVITLLVRRRLGRSALFRQQRPGIQGKPFTIYKFRTMTDARDGDDNLLPDAERLTRLGRLLRKTSMDELPELFNLRESVKSVEKNVRRLRRWTQMEKNKTRYERELHWEY
jgi:lipopolysaccharide/colanic/teichoic acid biosynthesis glycosyltransferase